MPRSSYSKIACLLMLALVCGSGAAFAQGAVGGYQLVSNTQVSPNERDVTYRARLTNTGGPIQSATATLVSAGNAAVVDGVLNFGPIPAGGSALSLDTFVLRQRGSSRPPVAWNVVTVPAGNQPDPATMLRIRTVPGVQAGEPFTVIVEAVNNSNNLDPNFSGPVTLSSLQAAVPANGQAAFNAAVAPVIAGGVATFTGLSINNAADGYTFAATSPGLSPASSNPFNVTATHLAVPAVANVRSGTAFGITAQARDANNNVAENFTGNIDLNAAATGGSNFVGGSQTAPSAGGAATFASLLLNNAADAYTVTANAVGLTSGISNAFNVTFTTLTVLPVASMQAGTLFNVQVEARDANGVLAENFAAASALSLINLQAAVPANGQVAFNAAVAPGFSAGVATFTSLGINNAANGYTFSAQATSSGSPVTDAINAGFNVTASFIAVGAVANVRSGTAFGLTAQARDANNSVAENFTGNIDLNAAATGGSNFVGGSQTAPSAGGAATFASLVLNNAADAYTVTANGIGLTSGISNAFNVTFTTLTVLPVANTQAGAAFNVQVEARDANGVLAENFAAASALSLINLQAAVPANGQTTFNAAVAPGFSAGVATFTSLGINNAADGYTFSAQATSSGNLVTDAINAGFNVTATHLAVLAVANLRSGTAFGLTAQARDANNSVAENFTGNIDLNAAATGGSNFVGGSKTAASAGGVASFASLVLNNAADGYTATANAIGLTNGISNAFNVTFTTLTVLPVASMQAGTLFNVQVEARDANGVLAENFAAANALSLINLQAAVPANGQVAFNAAVAPGFSAGVATFTSLGINNAANGYTFSAQATSSGSPVTDAINASFNVTATHLAVTTNLAGQTTGTPFNVAAQARDGNNSLAENFVGNINLNAAATGGANFNGGQQTVAALAGAAAFNNLVLNTAANGYVVTASAVGLTSGLSNSFNVAAGGGNGGADSLELDLSQSTVGAGATITITAIVRDSLGDPISPAPQVVFQILIDEGATGSTPTLLNNVIQTSADTRGGYVLRGTVNGTAVTDDVLFAVTQNATQSKNAGKFVTLAAAEGTVGLKLDQLLVAFENGNLAAIPAINTALQAARNSVVVTGRNAVQRGRPVAPEVGFLPSVAQLNAAGFTETPADAAFGLLIPQIVAKLDQVRQFYDALPTNPASGGADSVATLNQLNNELAALQGQLEGLDITPHAVVKHATAINNLIRNTMPAHMRSVAGKIGSVLQGNGLASLDATPDEFFDGVAPSGEQLARISPADFYGQPQPAFFGLLGLFGGCSLQMNLVNRIYGPVMAQVSRMLVILAANALLQEYLNPAVMEGLITGGSLSFFTNGEPGSVIEGSGMNADNVASNEVFFIGGAAVAAVEGLINAFNPSNINSFDDIDDYFEGIVDALQGAGEAYDQAEQPPDAVLHGCILDGGTNPSCSELVYNSGFESVSSCSGLFCFDFTVLVLYHNKDTGHWASGVFLFID